MNCSGENCRMGKIRISCNGNEKIECHVTVFATSDSMTYQLKCTHTAHNKMSGNFQMLNIVSSHAMLLITGFDLWLQ